MHIKSFTATTLSAALLQVKQEFGPDALVLSSRKLRRDDGWFGLLGKPVFEVVAAIDRDRRAESVAPRPEPLVKPDPSWQTLSLSKALVDPLHTELRGLRRTLERTRFEREADDSLRAELRELRYAVSRLSPAEDEPGSCESDEAAYRATLRAVGLSSAHAESIAAEAALRTRDSKGEPLIEALVERIDSRLTLPRPEDVNPVLMVGAAGVGKTTTVAKLAAQTPGSRPATALVTTDTLRLGAETQLRTWAERLDVPFAAAADSHDLAGRVRSFGRRKVLIDTAGRGRNDASALPELERLRAALDPSAHVHLVVSATTKEADLRSQILRYRSLRPDALVVAKSDESTDFGSVVNVLLDPDTPPLAWLGSGQRIPEDLELADPERVAARMMGVEA